MPNNNPHNALFIKTFSIRSEAKAFIQNFLPKWISENIDYRTFKQDNTSYINEDLKEYFSDIVYTCNWKNGKSIKISCLLEHKSYPPQNIYIQLNRYLTEGYQQQSLDKAKKKLILILPIIIYHGKQKWQLKSFADYFELPDRRLKEYLPNYTYELVDLSKGKEIGKKIGKEQGKKVKKAIISFRSLLLFFPIDANFSTKKIAAIADIKEKTVKSLYAILPSRNAVKIKKSALELLFHEIPLEKEDLKEIDSLIKDFLKT